ncbi:transglycosylase domain-containing protein [Candidatus Cytomitobacter primus]|nr:transglycosylase domain-containing protein [Candidatus Cytomitobacter primus]
MKFEPYIIFKDEKSNLIATYGDIKYPDIDIKDIPDNLPNALIALEDRRFWNHYGIDIFSIFRAIFKNFTSKKIVEGGSTITQQLAKNLLLHQSGKIPARSYTRKIREALLALKLEYYFTKEEILYFYLNRVYFGSRTYGINAACWKYFGKSVNKITLYESACLVSLLKAPSKYAFNAEKLNSRVSYVLDNMVDQSYITENQKEVALLNKSKLIHQINYKSIYYFTDWVVRNQIPSWISDMKVNLEIITTIDIKLQQHADKIASQIYNNNSENWNFEHISLIASDYQGKIKAMIGGVEYSSGGFNRATQAFRQTGSIFKFFVYLSALQNNITPGTLVDDSCPNINGWSPSNYYHKEMGFLPMEDGFIKSINGITVRLANHIGIENITSLSSYLGLSDTTENNLSISLGSSSASLLELVNAFGIIPNQGKKFKSFGITKITDKDNNQVLFKYIPDSKAEIIIKSDIAKEMGIIMKQVISPRGTGKSIKLPYPAAGKSGSSQEYRDFWFIGFTPNLIIGTWCGNDDYLKSMKLNRGPNPSVVAWKDFASGVEVNDSDIANWNKFFKSNKEYKAKLLT